MSRGTFSASNFLRLSSAPITAAPLTMAAWCWTTINNAEQVVLFVGASGSATNRNQFRLSCGAAGTIAAHTADGSNISTALTSTSYPTSTWFHAAAVYESTAGTDRAAFLNGGGKGTQTTDRTPTGVNRFSIGLQDNAAADRPFGGAGTGYIAWPAIWNTNLTDAEIALLAAGIPPWLVRPGSLVACWPMMGNSDGNELNWWPGAYEMVEQGTLPLGPRNPPIVMPFSFSRSISEVIAGGGGGGPAAQDYYLLRARRRGRR